MDFFVGQKVVCVDAETHMEWPQNKGHISDGVPIKRGDVYSVRWVGDYTSPRNGTTCASVRLDGVERGDNKDTPLCASRFRPVEYKAMSVFRKIAQDVTDGKVLEITDA